MLIRILQYLAAKQEIAPQAFPSVPRRMASFRHAPRNDMLIWWLVALIPMKRYTEICTAVTLPSGFGQKRNLPHRSRIACGGIPADELKFARNRGPKAPASLVIGKRENLYDLHAVSLFLQPSRYAPPAEKQLSASHRAEMSAVRGTSANGTSSSRISISPPWADG